MQSTFGKFTISILLTLGFVLVAEIAVRISGVQPQPWPSADGRKHPGIRTDPLLGPLPRPDFAGKWFGFKVEVDGDGFRSTGAPPPGGTSRRIAFVGDSCTFGWGLDTPETYIAQFGALQRTKGGTPLRLRNGGYPGQSAVVGEYVVRERILPWDPDFVVIAFSANNAFRLTLAADGDRLRMFGLRKLFLSSRLFSIFSSSLANQRKPPGHPRARQALIDAPLEDIYRVAAPIEFISAMRNMIRDVRTNGSEPVILLFPRASEVSDQFLREDAAKANFAQSLAPRGAGGEASARELGLLEVSCLDFRSLPDPLGALHDGIGNWEAVYPSNKKILALLRAGARSYVDGEMLAAEKTFAAAVKSLPRSPLAQYDLGVSLLALGKQEEGLKALDEANRLACNVFLQYQVLTRKLATELDVKVIDLMMYFQSYEGESLYLAKDPAHPNVEGAAIIAEALWSTLGQEPNG